MMLAVDDMRHRLPENLANGQAPTTKHFARKAGVQPVTKTGRVALMRDQSVGDVAARLRVLIEEFKIESASGLAKILGVERTRASNWVNGVNLPPVPEMTRLCEFYPITLDWIYRGRPEGLPLHVLIRLNARLAGDKVPHFEADPPETEPTSESDSPKTTRSPKRTRGPKGPKQLRAAS